MSKGGKLLRMELSKISAQNERKRKSLCFVQSCGKGEKLWLGMDIVCKNFTGYKKISLSHDRLFIS